jgi:hypothetical protein
MRFRLAAPACIALVMLLFVRTEHFAVPQSLPAKISDKEYWKMISDFSERNGRFNSENFVSNEIGYQKIIPVLKSRVQTNGVYIGVGPEQNFTFIAAVRPRIAFIIDIRRQNAIQHLMYKAIFELSENRADFLSRLFSVKRPAGLDSQSSVDDLFQGFDGAGPDPQLYERNLAALKDVLIRRHGFALSEWDVTTLEHVYGTFQQSGTFLNYAVGSKSIDRMPTYSELMRETDRENRPLSFLASEENYQIVRNLENNNLIIPVVGDFAGPTAVRQVGQYLRTHNARVSVFYLSNVESYLFSETDVWVKFYFNVAILPFDSDSQFVRSVLLRMPSADEPFAFTSEELLCPIEKLMNEFSAGKLVSYKDVIDMSSPE